MSAIHEFLKAYKRLQLGIIDEAAYGKERETVYESKPLVDLDLVDLQREIDQILINLTHQMRRKLWKRGK